RRGRARPRRQPARRPAGSPAARAARRGRRLPVPHHRTGRRSARRGSNPGPPAGAQRPAPRPGPPTPPRPPLPPPPPPPPAALGRTLLLGGLTAALGETTVTLLPAVDEVLRSGLVVTDRDRLSFASELVWRVALDSIPLSVRAGLSEDIRVLRTPSKAPTPV